MRLFHWIITISSLAAVFSSGCKKRHSGDELKLSAEEGSASGSRQTSPDHVVFVVESTAFVADGREDLCERYETILKLLERYKDMAGPRASSVDVSIYGFANQMTTIADAEPLDEFKPSAETICQWHGQPALLSPVLKSFSDDSLHDAHVYVLIASEPSDSNEVINNLQWLQSDGRKISFTGMRLNYDDGAQAPGAGRAISPEKLVEYFGDNVVDPDARSGIGAYDASLRR